MKRITVHLAIKVSDGIVRMPFQGYDYGNGLAICRDIYKYLPDGELVLYHTWQVCHIKSGWMVLGDLRTRKLAVSVAELFVDFLPDWNITGEEVNKTLHSRERHDDDVTLLREAIKSLIAQDAK